MTIHLPEMEETYHSKFGAIQEAYHVFIQNGLALFEGRPVSILEIGFGTGLNTLITYFEAAKTNQGIDYTGVEAYPVTPDEVAQLNYAGQLGADDEKFKMMHTSPWEQQIAISDTFKLTKRRQFFKDIDDVAAYDLIYFDAFGYPSQPELWSTDIFKIMRKALRENGILVTYACRTVIRKNLIEAGFEAKKLPGPPGKREMLRGKVL